IVVLGGLVMLGGIVLTPAMRMAEQAASVSLLHDVTISGAYHFDLRAENVMAVATWTIGSLLLVGRSVWWPAAIAVSRFGQRIGPERLYGLSLTQLNRFSDWLHDIEVRDLRSRIASILVPAGVLVGIALYVTPNSSEFTIGEIGRDDVPSIFMLLLAMFAAVAIALPRDHLNLALVLSCVGYSLSVLYAFMGAPNVALVAVLIETVFSLLFIGMLILMPRTILRYETVRRPEQRRVRRDALLASAAGVMAFFVVWGSLSKPAAQTTAIDQYIELTPLAHGKNVVTVVLADFRGLDTAGEITVIAVGLLGILSLLRMGRFR
ncbi:MAG: hydrogen gas-evolving membrane-bound hydrogenase subunit E, partial [Thermomicrobiales bacterium]